MTTINVNFFPQYEEPPRKGPRSFDKVRLQPGANEIDSDAWKNVSDDPLVKTLIDSKAIKVSEPETKPEPKATATESKATAK
jgi:hypothetical protein